MKVCFGLFTTNKGDSMARMKDILMETFEAIAMAPAQAKLIEKEAIERMNKDIEKQELETNHGEKSDDELDFEYAEHKFLTSQAEIERDLKEMDEELQAYRTNVVLELGIISNALRTSTETETISRLHVKKGTTQLILSDARERMKWVLAAIDAGKLW